MCIENFVKISGFPYTGRNKYNNIKLMHFFNVKPNQKYVRQSINFDCLHLKKSIFENLTKRIRKRY